MALKDVQTRARLLLVHVSDRGTVRGRGGPITAATDVPAVPILAGDHRRRDSSTAQVYVVFAHL